MMPALLTAATAIRSVSLSVRDGAGNTLLTHTFRKLRVTALSESLSGALSGTASLSAVPR